MEGSSPVHSPKRWPVQVFQSVGLMHRLWYSTAAAAVRRRPRPRTNSPTARAPASPPNPAMPVSMGFLPLALTAYALAVNLGAYGLFWWDKQQAIHKGWRVPERTLQLSALLGGWVGGIMAMRAFHHKTAKASFQQPYLLCIAGNVVAVAGLGLALFKSPASLMHFTQNFLRVQKMK